MDTTGARWDRQCCTTVGCCQCQSSSYTTSSFLHSFYESFAEKHLEVFDSWLWLNKKAVLSQRWPRDARYISRSWAVAEICPFEIIQDGGGCHLEFIRIENSAIRSAVSENSTLEPNMKWIGSLVAEIWPFAYGGGIWNPHFWGEGEVVGGKRWHH